jgi:CDP-4-dehydro-6-deoxyglucose reductase, E3
MLVRISAGKAFDTNGEDSLLEAARRAGITLPYSCKTGRCSTCKGLVRSGETLALQDETGLTAAERETGWILTCVRACRSDLLLDIEDLGDAALPAARTSACRIHSIDRLSSDVVKVVLRFPPGTEQKFRPGQYIDVIGHGGARRSYSIANAPSTENRIELHIREVEGGTMSRYWFREAKVNELLRINGPLGTFFLRDVTDRTLVFLATGTGIAPVKAMLEGLAGPMSGRPVGSPRDVWVFWGGRRPQDIYWQPDTSAVPLRFVPVLSRADDHWSGARGYVQQAAIEHVPDWTRAAVYACGSDAMIHSAQQALAARGLPPGQFRSDAFVCSAAA